MLDQSFRTMLANLEQQGELIRFDKEVDPLTNMAAVQWRAFNEMGKASLFTNIAGHEGWRACSQIVADRRKWSIGLGIEENALLSEVSTRLKRSIDTTNIDGAAAPCKEVLLTGGDVDIFDIPAPFTSEYDGGPYLAAGILVVRDPETGLRNVSIHRQQVTGKDKTGVVMLPRQTRRSYDKYRDRGEAMNDLLDEMQGERERLAGAGIEGLDTLTDGLGEALGDLRKATDSLLAVGADDPGAAMANAFNYMMLTGYVTGGWQMARVALAAKQALDGGTAETDFYRGKLAAARFYGAQGLPRAAGYARAVTAGAEAVLEPDPLAHF